MLDAAYSEGGPNELVSQSQFASTTDARKLQVIFSVEQKTLERLEWPQLLSLLSDHCQFLQARVSEVQRDRSASASRAARKPLPTTWSADKPDR